MNLHRTLVWGLLVIVGVSIAGVGVLIGLGVDGNGVAVIVSIVMALASQLGQIVRHLFPAPEFEAEPPQRKDQG